MAENDDRPPPTLPTEEDELSHDSANQQSVPAQSEPSAVAPRTKEWYRRKSLWTAFFSVVALTISIAFGVTNAIALRKNLENLAVAVQAQQLRERSYWLGKVDHTSLVINGRALSGTYVHRQQEDRLKASLSTWGAGYVFVVGSSGVGKTTVCERVLMNFTGVIQVTLASGGVADIEDSVYSENDIENMIFDVLNVTSEGRLVVGGTGPLPA